MEKGGQRYYLVFGRQKALIRKPVKDKNTDHVFYGSQFLTSKVRDLCFKRGSRDAIKWPRGDAYQKMALERTGIFNVSMCTMLGRGTSVRGLK